MGIACRWIGVGSCSDPDRVMGTGRIILPGLLLKEWAHMLAHMEGHQVQE